ncbi:DUF3575 domain-containing protein [Hymenobacter elongatus]|uniref:DUF3575 domain-containing protein n=1 Tax=Hymenobacter elongatus TaxID=877208 RepID=A0A4Z0PSG9_9BACT|nr:DUF3575 domain-containing protein [Hymenobacter elongatus]TGE19803.1 DUF3575 domain-containing protein [Hymenobacter elongatus]
MIHTVAICALGSAACLVLPADTLRRWAPRWAPLSLADPVRPTLQLGAEYFLGHGFSVGADVGTRLVLFKAYSRPEQQVRHHTFRVEGRYYLRATGWKKREFIAVEGFYVPYVYTQQHGILERNGTYFTYDEARIMHRTWGGSLKYGWHWFVGPRRRWWLETAVGLGMRRVPSRYSRIRNEQPADSAQTYKYLNQEWRLSFPPPDGGHLDRLHLLYSLRVGYRL